MSCLLKISELLQTELVPVRLAVGQLLKAGLTLKKIESDWELEDTDTDERQDLEPKRF